MLIIENGKLALSNKFVTCQGETKPIGEEGIKWWIDTCSLHGYDYEFSEANYSQEVLNRFEQIKDFDTKYIYVLEQFVSDGIDITLEELKIDMLKSENEYLKTLLLDLTTVVLGG